MPRIYLNIFKCSEANILIIKRLRVPMRPRQQRILIRQFKMSQSCFVLSFHIDSAFWYCRWNYLLPRTEAHRGPDSDRSQRHIRTVIHLGGMVKSVIFWYTAFVSSTWLNSLAFFKFKIASHFKRSSLLASVEHTQKDFSNRETVIPSMMEHLWDGGEKKHVLLSSSPRFKTAKWLFWLPSLVKFEIFTLRPWRDESLSLQMNLLSSTSIVQGCQCQEKSLVKRVLN